MESLDKRIADRIKRGKENAEEAMPVNPETGNKEKPSEDYVAGVTNLTEVRSIPNKPADSKKQAADWKPNA